MIPRSPDDVSPDLAAPPIVLRDAGDVRATSGADETGFGANPRATSVDRSTSADALRIGGDAEAGTILTLIDYYLPGYKGGGPIRTLANIVQHLGGELRFRIVTRDRDLGDAEPYAEGARREVGGAEVVYLAPGEMRRGIARLLRTPGHDALYLNSLFSATFTLWPLWLRLVGKIHRVPVIVAPRGELSPGALAFKSTKKRAFLIAARRLGLYRGVVWQASSPVEAEEVRRWFGPAATVVVAPDLPPPASAAPPPRTKRAGELRLAFVSRIDRKKNLDGAIRLLRDVPGSVVLDVYGPEEDAAYAAECRALAKESNADVRFHGPVPPERVAEVLREADAFFFPTHGENFGHVVLEALLAGCVPLLSDRTPWRGLEAKGIGWDLPLDRPEAFRAALAELVAMDGAGLAARSERAWRHAAAFAGDAEVVARTRGLFASVLAGAGRGGGKAS
ncbi:MAG TPA: glycosyltransferase family 4 protein [Longimicrobium sp.]|nr:glycosyltransferase family 4 protein [Longimicrobium sp.]